MSIARAPMTEAEFLRLPDDGRKYEFVDGEAKPVPTSFQHDQIAIHLARLIGPIADKYGYLTGGSAGFRMIGGNIRCPDLGFTRFERFPDDDLPEGFAEFAPDLCVEIISPSEEPADMQRKLREYFASGAQLVWHLFPETKRALVYTSPTKFLTLEADDEIDGGDILPGFRCKVEELFAVQKRLRP